MTRALLAALALVACAHPSPPAAPPAPAPAPTTGRYLPLFDRLVAQIAAEHVFAADYELVVGGSFSAFVAPRLRAEMAAARDRREAMTVLSQLQQSLRDGHCRWRPPRDLDERWWTIGLGLYATAEAGAPVVRVAKGDAEVPVGSTITAVDGQAVAAWLAAHPFESNLLVAPIALKQTAASIVGGSSVLLAPNAARTLAFTRPDGSTGSVTRTFADHDDAPPGPDVDHPPPTAAIACDAADPNPYGDAYDLTAVGVFHCVYTPRRGPRVPVVRYLSFFYGDGRRDQAAVLRQIKVDHDILKRALAGARGVVLDLHDNHGGNNPFLFYRWFAKKPWTHEVVRTRVLPDLDEAAVRGMFVDHAAYRAAQARGDATLESRFLCLPPPGDPQAPPRCDDVPPIPGELVTKAKVAVIVGPRCMSSCDTFALSWSHFEDGPIVGRQPAHAYTVVRRTFPIKGPDDEDLGEFCVGLSSSHLRGGPAIEGRAIDLDLEIPDRFDNRDTWVREAVDAATRRLLGR